MSASDQLGGAPVVGVDAPEGDALQKDAAQLEPGFGHGGVPWYLLLLYLGFLTFFTWYTLTYQLPDFLDDGPGQSEEAAPTAPAGD